jgi:hypothetical protein
MKIIGWFLVIGMLLSYTPVFHMDECPEGNHLGNMKMDCGVPFHCPMIVDIAGSGISSLPLKGLLVPTGMHLLRDGLVSPVFHPPECLSQNLISRG